MLDPIQRGTVNVILVFDHALPNSAFHFVILQLFSLSDQSVGVTLAVNNFADGIEFDGGIDWVNGDEHHRDKREETQEDSFCFHIFVLKKRSLSETVGEVLWKHHAIEETTLLSERKAKIKYF